MIARRPAGSSSPARPRGRSAIAPLAFGAVAGWAGSERPAVLSVIPFHVIGFLLLFRVDVDRARAASGRAGDAADAAGGVAS